MGAIRFIFGIIFIIYGIVNLINGSFTVLGMVAPLSGSDPVTLMEFNVILSEIIPLQLFGIIIVLWGLLWIWIGNKVRTGGQPVQRFSKRK